MLVQLWTAEVRLQNKGCLVLHVPWTCVCKSYCEAGTMCLRAGVLLCGSSILTWHSLPSSPAQESPTAVPPMGQLVLRGALAYNNPALMSGAQKT